MGDFFTIFVAFSDYLTFKKAIFATWNWWTLQQQAMLYGMFYIQIIHGLALGLYSTYYYLCSIIFYKVLQLGLLKLSEVVDPCSQHRTL